MNFDQVLLRATEKEDFEYFFNWQLDDEACRMAAFTSKNRFDKQAYMEKYLRLFDDPTINMQTVINNDTIVGSISKFVIEGDAEITYWIDKTYWGRGFAVQALQQMLLLETIRPLFARVAYDNIGSQKVLEKCGFKKIGSDIGFANARNQEIEEFIYNLS